MELDERFEAPTLWGSTAFIADEIMRLGREMMSMDLEVKPIQMEVGWLKTSVQTSALTSEESLAKLMKILGLVMQRIQSVGPELELVKTRVGKMELAQVELQQEECKPIPRHPIGMWLWKVPDQMLRLPWMIFYGCWGLYPVTNILTKDDTLDPQGRSSEDSAQH
jgi:hypothetical protein